MTVPFPKLGLSRTHQVRDSESQHWPLCRLLLFIALLVTRSDSGDSPPDMVGLAITFAPRRWLPVAPGAAQLFYISLQKVRLKFLKSIVGWWFARWVMLWALVVQLNFASDRQSDPGRPFTEIYRWVEVKEFAWSIYFLAFFLQSAPVAVVLQITLSCLQSPLLINT